MPWGAVHGHHAGLKLVMPGRSLMRRQSLISSDQSRSRWQRPCRPSGPEFWRHWKKSLDGGRWRRNGGFVGGTAVPEALVRKLDARGLPLIQVWGMTETTPVAVCSTLKAHMLEWTEEERYRVRVRQGRALPFMEVRVVNDNGEAPWDGTTLGEIQVKGPWVAASYFNAPGTEDRWTADGWLRTGDVATIDPEGYVQIADRAKD